jgi:hypothetical protein
MASPVLSYGKAVLSYGKTNRNLCCPTENAVLSYGKVFSKTLAIMGQIAHFFPYN